jgi:hypothetical protein
MGRDSTVRAGHFSEVNIQCAGPGIGTPGGIALIVLRREQFRYVSQVASLSQY